MATKLPNTNTRVIRIGVKTLEFWDNFHGLWSPETVFDNLYLPDTYSMDSPKAIQRLRIRKSLCTTQKHKTNQTSALKIVEPYTIYIRAKMNHYLIQVSFKEETFIFMPFKKYNFSEKFHFLSSSYLFISVNNTLYLLIVGALLSSPILQRNYEKIR